MVQYVDWDLAAATAAALGRTGPAATFQDAADAVAELRQLSEEAAAHVEEYTGLTATGDHAPIRVVDRPDWARANIGGLQQVIVPILARVSGREPSAVLDSVGSRLAGVQAGVVLAYLSGRVLGQYEVFSADPGQLLLVAPNIVATERKLGAVPRDFRLWVCLHEVTHRTQFTAVPWLREHFLGEISAFVAAGGGSDQIVERLRQALSSIVDVVRDQSGRSSVLELVQTPAQREVLDRITALMTLLEGHAEFVMDGVGPEVVPTVAEIRERFNQRRQAGHPVERLIRRMLGIEAKLRQYAEGRQFVHDVVDQIGMSGFNRIWQSPASLPRRVELTDASAWIARVGSQPAPTG